jgi:hypothetical protein
VRKQEILDKTLIPREVRSHREVESFSKLDPALMTLLARQRMLDVAQVWFFGGRRDARGSCGNGLRHHMRSCGRLETGT